MSLVTKLFWKYIHSSGKNLFLLFLSVSFVSGCGVKADPVVPHSPIPQAIRDLEATSYRGKIILQWSIPKKDSDEKKLTNVGGFRIWRQFTPIDKIGCSTCEAEFQLIVEIDYPSLQKELGGQEKVAYWDDQVEQEGQYAYKITSFTTAGVESGFSKLSVLNWFSPLPPPISLRAIPGDQFVDLSWEFPPSLEKGQPKDALGGFNIYRRLTGQEYGLTPLNQRPIQENTYRDVSVTNGEKYYYVACSVKTTPKTETESEDSVEVAIVPEDFTPPAAPSATLAFQSPEGVAIVWEPNLDPDLWGYYVYRRLESGDKPTRISPLLQRVTMYVDKTYSPEVTYYYSVTAIDRSPRHNESVCSQEFKVVTQTP